MNAIEIVITGVVYLLGPSATGKPVDVIIPNVSAPAAPFGNVLAEHYAYVKLRKKDIQSCTAPCSRHPDLSYTGSVSSTEFVVYGLHGDQITLKDGDLTPDPLEICTANCPRKLSELQPGETDQLLAYTNIPAHADVCKTCGALRDEYLTSNNPDLIAARLTLDKGKLSAGHPDSGSEWLFQPSRFKFANVTYHHQMVADQAVLSAASTGPVTLTVKRLEGDVDGIHTLVLVLDKDAQIEVGNLMPSDLLGMGHHAPEAVDVHFGSFYRMMSDPVPSDPPIPHRKVFPEADPGGPRANCIPLRGTT
jgi:hypothetical protein